MAGTLYDAIADRVDPQEATTLENFVQRLQGAAKLLEWQPTALELRRQSRELTRARLTVAIHEQQWDKKTKQSALALLSLPGRPPTAKGAAAEAWELRHLKGLSWPKIEGQLLPDWTYASPGETIRREVGLLEVDFKSYGIKVPNIRRR